MKNIEITLHDLTDYQMAASIHDIIVQAEYDENVRERGAAVVNEALTRIYLNGHNPEMTPDEVNEYLGKITDEEVKRAVSTVIGSQFNAILPFGFDRMDNDGNVEGVDVYATLVHEDGVESDPIQHMVDIATTMEANVIKDENGNPVLDEDGNEKLIGNLPVAIIKTFTKNGQEMVMPRTISVDLEELAGAN